MTQWEELLKRARTGDDQARNRLLEELRPRMLEQARRWLCGPCLANHQSDVLQSVIRKVLEQGINLPPTLARFLGWLGAMIHNRCMDVWNDEARKPRPLPFPEELKHEDNQTRDQLALLVWQGLQSLPERYRQVLEWAFYDRLSAVEIGRRMSPPISAGAVGVLKQHVADRLKMRAQFVQTPWDMLFKGLERDDIDLVFNGYGWTPQRGLEMNSTIPYGVVRLRLIVRKGEQGPGAIRDWDDLRRPGPNGKPRVGTLRASASEQYLLKQYADDVEIEALGADGTVGVLWMLKQKRLDASVQDEFTAGHYVKHDFPDELEIVGEPRDSPVSGMMVGFTRRDNPELRDRINEALLELMRDGTLKRIYLAYGVWHEGQEKLEDVARHWPPPEEATSADLGWYFWTLLKAAGMTVLLACVSMPGAMLLGLCIALGRVYGPTWLRAPLAVYVEVLRGTPLLLQLFAIYYLLPSAGIFLPAFWAGAIGLAINYSAYESENYRMGLLAVPRGQMEAALTLGMSRWTALRRIILPQACRTVVPAVTNDFIAMFKDTSVCSVIAVVELTGSYHRLLVDQPRLIVPLALLAALLYLMMSYPLALLARRFERRPQLVAA